MQNCAEHTIESKQQLKTGGLKITSARLSLFDIFKHAKKPLSVKQIAHKLKNSSVDLVTLYRNVESLAGLGYIKSLHLAGNQAYYELADSHHHHIVCQKCGKIQDVENCNIKNLQAEILKKSGFAKIDRHALEFFGVCKSCSIR